VGKVSSFFIFSGVLLLSFVRVCVHLFFQVCTTLSGRCDNKMAAVSQHYSTQQSQVKGRKRQKETHLNAAATATLRFCFSSCGKCKRTPGIDMPPKGVYDFAKCSIQRLVSFGINTDAATASSSFFFS